MEKIAQQINSALNLRTEAVAVTFCEQSPASSEAARQAVPAGCVFWQQGSDRRLTTSANDHRHCAIGIHTHHLSGAPASHLDELQVTLATMQGLDYVRGEEVEALPRMARASAGVIYEPLSQSLSSPDCVLLMLDTQQSLILTEAVMRVDGSAPLTMGRPACALIPQVIGSGKAAMSLGCCGARAYLDAWDESLAVWGLPGDQIQAYVSELETLAQANAVLTRFHELRREDISAGVSPTVNQSLERLSESAESQT